MKRKILSIWIGLCYISLTILLGACGESCCCEAPTTNLGTIFIFPNLVVANNSSCSSSLFQITSNQFVGSDNGVCDTRGSFWNAEVLVRGTKIEGSDTCTWEKNYTISGEFKFTVEQRNGRFALKLTNVPLGSDLILDITIKEPKQNSSCNLCIKSDGQGNPIQSPYSNTYHTVVPITGPVNNLNFDVRCEDEVFSIKCCN